MQLEQNFTKLLARNKDWIISKVLIAAKDYKQQECLSLINHSWKQTIESFFYIITQSFESLTKDTGVDLYRINESKQITEFANKEVVICNNRSIEPHVYISFLKVIKAIYKGLIYDANVPAEDKTSYYKHIENCFYTIFFRFKYKCRSFE